MTAIRTWSFCLFIKKIYYAFISFLFQPTLEETHQTYGINCQNLPKNHQTEKCLVIKDICVTFHFSYLAVCLFENKFHTST